MFSRLVPAAVAAVSIALLAPAVPAVAADSPNCVSRSEYRKVHRGDGKNKVHRIFDIDGRRQAISQGGGYAFEVRSYKSCTKYGAVSIGFEKEGGGKWKLSSKSAVW